MFVFESYKKINYSAISLGHQGLKSFFKVKLENKNPLLHPWDLHEDDKDAHRGFQRQGVEGGEVSFILRWVPGCFGHYHTTPSPSGLSLLACGPCLALPFPRGALILTWPAALLLSSHVVVHPPPAQHISASCACRSPPLQPPRAL